MTQVQTSKLFENFSNIPPPTPPPQKNIVKIKKFKDEFPDWEKKNKKFDYW